MASDNAGSVAVIDFRRHGMMLQWHVLGGTWTAFDDPPSLLHGIALIRGTLPNVCLYGQSGRLRLQVGPEQFLLADESLRVTCSRGTASFGLRRRVSVESASAGVLFSRAYWRTHGEYRFFRWLASHARNLEWRAATGRRWTEGVSAAELRSL